VPVAPNVAATYDTPSLLQRHNATTDTHCQHVVTFLRITCIAQWSHCRHLVSDLKLLVTERAFALTLLVTNETYNSFPTMYIIDIFWGTRTPEPTWKLLWKRDWLLANVTSRASMASYTQYNDHCSLLNHFTNALPSVLWHCWLGGRKGIRPIKKYVGMVDVGTG